MSRKSVSIVVYLKEEVDVIHVSFLFPSMCTCAPERNFNFLTEHLNAAQLFSRFCPHPGRIISSKSGSKVGQLCSGCACLEAGLMAGSPRYTREDKIKSQTWLEGEIHSEFFGRLFLLGSGGNRV